MKGIKLFLFFFTLLFIASCSNEKQTAPVETAVEDKLTKLLESAPEEIRAEITNEIQGELRREISAEINSRILSYANSREHFFAFINAVSPAPGLTGRCDTLLTVDSISGNGIGTTIHWFTALQSHCLNPETNEFSDGEGVFTASGNGDQLFQAYAGNLRPTVFQNIFIVNGTTNFTGGTGQFAGATGGGAVIGLLHVTSGKLALIHTGTLNIINP